MKKYHQQDSGRWQLLTVAALLVVGLFLMSCRANETEPYKVAIFVGSYSLVQYADGFKVGMAELGYEEGTDIVYIYDGPLGEKTPEELAEIAEGYVAQGVDLIISITTPHSTAAYEATQGTDIPVLFSAVTDPVKSGLIEDYHRPGGNMTGLRIGMEGNAQDGLRLEWLVKAVPGIEQVYIVYNPENAFVAPTLETLAQVAPELGVELVHAQVADLEEAKAAFENIPEEVDAVFVMPDTMVGNALTEVAWVQTELPFTASVMSRVEDGVLLGFGSDSFTNARVTLARMADQIFEGADPAELPVEVPEYFLTINMQTADTLQLDIPEEVLRQADRLIRGEDN